MREVLERRQFDLEVVLENLVDPLNASAIVRSADAFGVGAVGLLYTDVPIPRISRLASGFAAKWTLVHPYHSQTEALDHLQARELRLVVAQPRADAVPYWEVDWTRPTALVVGQERCGCSEEILAAADAVVKIPMEGFGHSINVAAAAAILLAEAGRQRRLAGLYAPQWDERRERILAEWIRREEERPPAPKTTELPEA